MNQLPLKNKKTRRYRYVFGGVVLLVLMVAGPNAVFYAKWLWPTRTIPHFSAEGYDQWTNESVAQPLIDYCRKALIASHDKVRVPSVSAAVGFAGELQWAGSIGFAEIETAKPSTVSSRYRIGSTSKALTSVLLARLIDAKLVELDKPVGEYVDGLPAHIRSLTARMLASHTAGVRHYSRFPTYWLGWHESYSSKAYVTVEDGLELFIHDGLRFEPGTGFYYSTFGYSLLSRLLEGATGEDFKKLLEKRLFEPAGMADTALDLAGTMPERVGFYTTASGKYTAAYPTDASYKIAGGGIVSTPSDLVRLGMALLGDDFISETAKGLLWTPVKLADGSINPQNYGLGWRIGKAKGFGDATAETLIIHHGGVQEGGVCFLMIAPELGIAAAAVANTGEAAARSEVQRLASELIRITAGK